MKHPLLAKRYARSLWAVAAEQKNTDQVEQALGRFCGLLEQNPDLAKFVSHPLASKQDKLKVAQEVLGGEAPEVFIKFLSLIFEKRADLSFRQIFEQYQLFSRESKGQVQAEVVSSALLSEQEKKQLQEILKGKLQKDVLLKESVDPGLMGGLIVKVGDKVWDGSLGARLRALREQLLQN